MSLQKLGVITTVGAASCLGMSWLVQRKLSNILKASNLYNEAMDIIKSHEAAKLYLGISEAKVAVCGPKSKGTAFITVTGDSPANFKLDSIELQLEFDQSKRLVIKEPKREISTASD